MESGRQAGETVVAIVVRCGILTGCVALLAGALAFLSGEFVGAGVCFAAAGISFGLIASAMLRS